MKCWPREREENSYTGERRNNQRSVLWKCKRKQILQDLGKKEIMCGAASKS